MMQLYVNRSVDQTKTNWKTTNRQMHQSWWQTGGDVESVVEWRLVQQLAARVIGRRRGRCIKRHNDANYCS